MLLVGAPATTFPVTPIRLSDRDTWHCPAAQAGQAWLLKDAAVFAGERFGDTAAAR